MDNQQPTTHQNELEEKIKILLARATSLSSLNKFIIESIVESGKAKQAMLQNLCNQLEIFMQNEERIYQEYKQNMKKAVTDYKQSVLQK